MSVGASAEAQLVEQAVRVYRRYAVEIVEGLVFCPYAEKVRVDGGTRELVVSSADPSDEEVSARVEEISDDESVEIGLVLFPRLVNTRQELGRWVEVLRKAHAAWHGGRAVLAIEGFHPDAHANLENAERLTPYVRRTPDPTLQLTRLSVLTKVRRGTPTGTAFFDPDAMNMQELLASEPKAPLHERIAEMNLETVNELGVPEIDRRYEAILADRDAAYAAIDPSIIRRAGA